MSLQSRLADFIAVVGADIKAIQATLLKAPKGWVANTAYTADTPILSPAGKIRIAPSGGVAASATYNDSAWLDPLASDYVKTSSLTATAITSLVTAIPTGSTAGVTGDRQIVLGTGDIYERQADGSWSNIGNILGLSKVPTGKWFRTCIGITAANALVLNQLQLFPFRVPSDMQSWSDFALTFSTTVSGSQARLGIMPDLNGFPDIANVSEGVLDTSTSTGRKIWTPTSPIVLRGGTGNFRRMWAGVVSQGGANGPNITTATSPESPVFDIPTGSSTTVQQFYIPSITGTILSAAGSALTISNFAIPDLYCKAA